MTFRGTTMLIAVGSLLAAAFGSSAFTNPAHAGVTFDFRKSQKLASIAPSKLILKKSEPRKSPITENTIPSRNSAKTNDASAITPQFAQLLNAAGYGKRDQYRESVHTSKQSPTLGMTPQLSGLLKASGYDVPRKRAEPRESGSHATRIGMTPQLAGLLKAAGYGNRHHVIAPRESLRAKSHSADNKRLSLVH